MIQPLRQRLAAARLYLVADAGAVEWLDDALRGGVHIVQLRAKDASDADILAAAAEFRRMCDAHGALFILNDRPDLAAAARADGVHVGQDDMPVPEARRLIGSDLILGLSTHSPAQIEAATGVDYIGVGPVYSTPTKPGRPAVGLQLLVFAAAHARVPWFAIGGIDATNLQTVRNAGATRIAIVRAIAEASDPEAAARALMREPVRGAA